MWGYMSNSDTIASLGLILSLAAFIISLRSYGVAKKSLNISKDQHNERSLGIKLYYIDAYKWISEDDKYISFALRFTNLSSLPSTILKIELHIEYHDENNVLGKVKVHPDTTTTPVNLKKYSDIISQPLNISNKSAKAGWVTFKLPPFLKEQLRVDLYQVIAETIDGKTISINTHIINEV